MKALLLVALAALAAAPPRAAHAYCRTTTPLTPPGRCETGTPVSWPVTCVGVFINTHDLSAPPDGGQDLGPLVRRYVLASADAWSDARCGDAGPSLRLVVAGEVDAALDLALDGRNVVSVNRRWSPDAHHRPGTLAFTVISTDVPTGALLEADVELNALAMENPLGREFGDGAPVWGVADAPSVLLHELGHVAGLWHSLEAGAVMEASMDVERQRRSLTDDDRRGVCAMYPVRAGRERPVPGCVPERAVISRAPPAARGGCSAAGGLASRRAGVLLTGLVVLGVGRRGRRGRSNARTA